MFFSVKIYRRAFLLLLVLVFFCGRAGASSYPEKDFFSYVRFSGVSERLAKLTAGGQANKDIKDFAVKFSGGMRLLASGDIQKAETELLTALAMWPEYYGTDFILALMYERSGDMESAARFYRSYLYKLKNLELGRYRISGALISVLAGGEVEDYDTAHNAVKEHLAGRGIVLGSVRPVTIFPAWLIYVVFLLFFVALYLLIAYKWVPYRKRMKLIKNPPEGFWVCRYCWAVIPDLCKVCQECGRLREEAEEKRRAEKNVGRTA